MCEWRWNVKRTGSVILKIFWLLVKEWNLQSKRSFDLFSVRRQRTLLWPNNLEREREGGIMIMMMPVSVSVLQNTIIFQEPPSILITAMSASTFMFLLYIGFSEIIGRHLQYSKFWNVNSNNKPKPKPKQLQIKLSSRTGMLILYTPAFLAALASFFIFPDGGLRFMTVKSAVTFHFLKRDLEVI